MNKEIRDFHSKVVTEFRDGHGANSDSVVVWSTPRSVLEAFAHIYSKESPAVVTVSKTAPIKSKRRR